MSKFKPMWEIRQSASPGALDLYIYGDVESDGYDWWYDEVIESETSANHFRKELAQHPNVQQINIYINSWGGSVFEGTAIYNQLKRHPAHKTVYVDGFACSIASVIAMAGDEVVMPRNTLMMIHNMCLGCYGNAAALRKSADDLDIINAAGRGAYMEKAGDKLDESTLVEMMDAETWLTAEQCIQYGLADRYADKDADMENASAVLQKANLSLNQRVQIQKSLTAQLKALTAQAQVPPVPVPPEKTPHEEVPGPSLFQSLAGLFNT